MSIAHSLLPEYDREMSVARTALERVPDDGFAFQPHAKSMSMEALTTHLANLPSWTVMTLRGDEFDMAPPGGDPIRVDPVASSAAALEAFDRNVADGRAAIMETSDEEFMKPWRLLSGGQEVFTMPKIAVLRSFVMNHLIHHRAQLGVYLRLNDIPLPAMYGPSADEQPMT